MTKLAILPLAALLLLVVIAITSLPPTTGGHFIRLHFRCLLVMILVNLGPSHYPKFARKYVLLPQVFD